MSETTDSETAQETRAKKPKPKKALPTERIKFEKQLAMLRAYVIRNSTTGKPVTNREIAEIVEMSEGTTSLGNSFFLENGLLQKGEGGYLPSQDVISFARAQEWNQENPAYKLAPALLNSWFAQALIPKLRFRAMSLSEAVGTLADTASADKSYGSQIRLLVDYLEAAGLLLVEGEQVRVGPTAQQDGRPQPQPEAPARESQEPKPSKPESQAAPNEGLVQFDISLRVQMSEIATWTPDRIAAFFGGIANVLAAKGGMEGKRE